MRLTNVQGPKSRRGLNKFQMETYGRQARVREAIETQDPSKALAEIRTQMTEFVEERRKTLNPEGEPPELNFEWTTNISMGKLKPQVRLVITGDETHARSVINFLKLRRNRDSLNETLAKAGWKGHKVSLIGYANSLAARITRGK